MWKLLLIAFLARVSGAPLAPELPGINCFKLFGIAVGTYRCPPSPISSNQSGSPIDTNYQPMPFGVSNTGANFYQNFVLNGVVPSGRNNSDPPQAPKRDDHKYKPGVGPPSPISYNQSGSPINTNLQPMPFGVSNTGANFYQNFVLNGVVPSGRSNSDPPQAPKRDDYTYTPGVGAHKLNIEPLTWNAARKACNEDGGHLAIINSDEEARILAAMISDLCPVEGSTHEVHAYLGIHDLYDEGDWVTIFGVSLANTGFKKWSTGSGIIQPNNLGNNQHCGALKQDGNLDDVTCTFVYPYFCELTNV